MTPHQASQREVLRRPARERLEASPGGAFSGRAAVRAVCPHHMFKGRADAGQATASFLLKRSRASGGDDVIGTQAAGEARRRGTRRIGAQQTECAGFHTLMGRACHPRRVTPQQTTAFVLGGGGILGAAEVGMLRALLEREIVPDLDCRIECRGSQRCLIAADPSTASVSEWSSVWTGLSDRGYSADPCSANSARWLVTGRTSMPTKDSTIAQ